jgi:hypothetical protein
MKNRSSKRRLPDFFRQRLHGKVASGHMPKLGTPESERLEAESLIEDLLRWADDGGQMLDLDHSQYSSNLSNTLAQFDNHGS